MLSTFSHRAEVSKFRNRDFLAKSIKEDIVIYLKKIGNLRNQYKKLLKSYSVREKLNEHQRTGKNKKIGLKGTRDQTFKPAVMAHFC